MMDTRNCWMELVLTQLLTIITIFSIIKPTENYNFLLRKVNMPTNDKDKGKHIFKTKEDDMNS